MNNNRSYIELKLKNLISKSGIRLINLFFKGNEFIDIHYARLGEVGLFYDENMVTINTIEDTFQNELGFELIKNVELQLVEQIKIAVLERIAYANNMNSLIRNSDYISEKVQTPYDKLSRIFSIHTGKTLEQYILAVKIERIKRLLIQNEFSVSEISYIMGYSSVQYLSRQFKKMVGKTVSEYRKDPSPRPIALEDIV